MSALKIMPVPEGWITRQEAAARAGVCVDSLSRWVKAGRVESARIWDDKTHSYPMWVNPDTLPTREVQRSWKARRNLLGEYLPDDGFTRPAPAGQCHNLTCGQPSTDLSTLHLCAEHEMVLRSQKGALARKPSRCYVCQCALGVHNKTGRCNGCSARRNGRRAA